jgi:putative salt-induced outer membrane protein YdiY
LINANYDRFLDQRRFAYARASLENDEFKDIRVRATAGAGLGWQVFDTEKIELALRGGLDYVVVDRKDGESDNYPALGWGINYSHWLWPDRLELFHDQQGFINLHDTQNITLRTKTGVRLPIGSGLTANAQLNYDYEGDPGPDTSKSDAQILLGVGYEF